MIVFPNAKINIGLDILRKRPDGYHDISTVFYPVSWCDILEIVPAKGTSTTLTVTGRVVPCPPEKNLVMKAYRTLAEDYELPPVDIYLNKVIPDGAGLGGGSADAAFTLTALNSMLDLRLSKEELAHYAETIGADCPFFIYNKPMIAGGTGTELEPMDLSLKGMEIAIVKPRVSMPTALAYASITPKLPERQLGEILAELSPAEWRGAVKNDFEPVVTSMHKEVQQVRDTLYNKGAVYAAMSGSGSAVFGLFDQKTDNMAEQLRKEMPLCDIFTGVLK